MGWVIGSELAKEAGQCVLELSGDPGQEAPSCPGLKRVCRTCWTQWLSSVPQMGTSGVGEETEAPQKWGLGGCSGVLVAVGCGASDPPGAH